jgi:2-C-methyl-D-erythritol 4-phosphate cytidylyltransferase
MMEKFAIIVAGGSGVRMGGSIPKQFQLLKGKPVLWYSIKAFTDAFTDIQIILVIPVVYYARTETIISEFPGQAIRIATGGDTRFLSVKNGLDHVAGDGIVFIHDGVRCLVTPALIHKCYEETIEKGNAIPAIAATDTIRIETAEGNRQIDRNSVRIIQTPQTFRCKDIKAAFLQEYDPYFTDEASVIERTGIKINLLEGEAGNIKITRPVDLLIAEKILDERR